MLFRLNVLHLNERVYSACYSHNSFRLILISNFLNASGALIVSGKINIYVVGLDTGCTCKFNLNSLLLSRAY